MVGIYKMTSPSGKIYIGQSWNITKRFDRYRRMQCKEQSKLYNSLNKYGLEAHNFMIIYELPNDITQSVLDTYEQLYIDLYRDLGLELLNLREGGSRGKHSEETRRKMRYMAENPTENMLKAWSKLTDNNNPRRMKGFYNGKKHPREYKVQQLDLNRKLIRTWDSIKEINKELGYSKSNLSQAVSKKNKYYNSYWCKTQ